MSDIIICRLDEKKMLVKHLARHLKLYHQKNYQEYIGEHIEDFTSMGWRFCSVCKKPVKGMACPGECIKQHYSNTRKGIPKGPMSEETKNKLSKDKKQKYANGWNPRTGKFHTEESKKQMSNTQKKRFEDPKNHPFYGRHHTNKTKEQISKTRIESGVAKGEKNGMFGKTHTPEAIKKIFSHRPMNRLEKLVANELDKANIPYHFQFFITENKVCKSYDFKIKGKPLIIEVDGGFWHGNPNQLNHHIHVEKTKKNDVFKNELAARKGYQVIRIWESDIKKDPSIILKSVNG